jgi:hypothetical protein
MLKRGHTLFEPQGPVWVRSHCLDVVVHLVDLCDLILLQSIHASDYHPQLVGASADGSCSTTNLLRSTRRGGSVVRSLFSFFLTRDAVITARTCSPFSSIKYFRWTSTASRISIVCWIVSSLLYVIFDFNSVRHAHSHSFMVHATRKLSTVQLKHALQNKTNPAPSLP